MRTFGSAILIMLRRTGVSEPEQGVEGIPVYRTFKPHGHFTRYYPEVWKPYLISFMQTSIRPRRLVTGRWPGSVGRSLCGEPTRAQRCPWTNR